MSNEKFKRSFSALLKRVGDKADLVVRKTALELLTGMVEKSPVDTGRFRGAWVCGIGVVNNDNEQPEDKSGSSSIARTAAALPAWKPGQTIWLTNSLPYSRVLEFGREDGSPGSKQAPGGMVRITVQNYATFLENAVKGMS
jgi:hypothetical protein